MRRFTGLLAAVFLTLLTLLGVTTRVGATPRRPARHGVCHLTGAGPVRPRHPHFQLTLHPLPLVAASSHRRMREPLALPQPPAFGPNGDTDEFYALGDFDTDTYDGVFTMVSYRHSLASDTRELDLPLGVDTYPQAPVAWPRSPRGPPVA